MKPEAERSSNNKQILAVKRGSFRRAALRKRHVFFFIGAKELF